VRRAASILLLLLLALQPEPVQAPVQMLCVYVLSRTAMDASYPLSRALLMDYVSKQHRAKWATVESVTSFFWSASAYIGGLIIARQGWQAMLLVSVSMQGVAWAVCLLLLLPASKEPELIPSPS
jgi:MFS family permease